MEQSKVSIDLKEYNEFVISQYENGKIKTSLLDEIKRLKETYSKLLQTHEDKVEINNSFRFKKEVIIELVFKRNKMGPDTREEQISINDDYIGNYAGVHKNYIPLLEEIYITKTEIVDYINKQWDIKDAADKIVKDAAELKAKEDAANNKEENEVNKND